MDRRVRISGENKPFLICIAFLALLFLSGCVGVTTLKSNSGTSTADTSSTTSESSGLLSASPAAVTFGNVSVGAATNQSLTLTNPGTSPVTISQVATSGAGFAVGGVALPVTLNTNNSATFTATFAPTAPGSVSGKVSFSSTQSSSTFSVQLSGTGAAVAPAITAQPVSQSILTGQTASFSVTATGTPPLNYQWQSNGSPISGANSSAYMTPQETTSANGAQFTVVVSNATGSITSTAATLSVTTSLVAPSITTQPVNQTIFAGQTATFSIVANGTSPLSYQWQKNGIAISGANSASYTTPAETTSNNGALFSVIVSNSAGTLTSNTATLTVNPDPAAPSITSQPASLTITTGETATFSVTATGTAPLSYQWNHNGTAISGATSSSYTTPVETTSSNGAQFSVVVSNSAGTVNSNTATLTVNPGAVAPSITSQPANLTITAGETATFSVTATGTAPLSYQWNHSGTAISGATSSSYTTPAETTSASGAQFTVVVSNTAGSVTSSAAVLTVNPAPVAPSITTQPSSQTITAGQTATFSVTATGTAPLSYQWNQSGTAISGATSSSYTTLAETTSASGSQFSVVVSNSAGSVTSNAATLTVNAAAPGAFTPSTTSLTFGNVSVGSNSALNVNFTNSGSSNITISSVTISGAGFTASGVSNGQIVTPGQAVTLNVTFAPAGSSSVTGTVTVTSNASNSPTTISLSGTGIPSTVTSITVTPANQTISIGQQVQFEALDQNGNNITAQVIWSVSNSSVASITTGGLVTAIANGNITITATE